MTTRRTRPGPQPRSTPAADTLSGIVETDGDTTIIRLVGSLRAASASALREAVDAALDQRPRTVVLDLAEVSADDDLGLWVLPAMAGDAGRRGIELIVAAPERSLRVRLRRLGGHHLEITDTPSVRGRSLHVLGDMDHATVTAALLRAPHPNSPTPVPESW